MSNEQTARFCRTASIALAVASVASLGHRLGAAPPPATIIVETSAQLEAALTPSSAGASILVRAGDYTVAHPLTVPDGATLAGEGVMSFDASGLPAGFEASGRTVLRATATLAGDVLTLGNDSTIRDLAIEDVTGRRAPGNAIAVVSRAPGDFVSATVAGCEVIDPNPAGVTPQGPSGRGLAIYTRNPNLGLDPPPHEGTVLSVRLTQSILRSPGGIFAINFASRGELRLEIRNNVINGGLDVSGGVGRPDAVSGSTVIIQSRDNLYWLESPLPTIGWSLLGGSDAPSPLFQSEASTDNLVQVHSVADRIEGFGTGIRAAGGFRFRALSASISSNRVELNLQGTDLKTVQADWTLFGAVSLVDPSTGDDNTLRVVARQATGSGPRANKYGDSSNPPTGARGMGNRLEIVGNANAFDRTNENIAPPPPAEFFSAGR